MGKMIYVGSKCKNPKKKPGWQETKDQEALWLKSINSMKLFEQPGKKFGGKVAIGKKVEIVKDGNLPAAAAMVVSSPKLANYTTMPGTKQVIRPEIMYKHDPELAERERIARARKFNTAPAYNKGPDIFVTEEHLMTQLSGNKRRS